MAEEAAPAEAVVETLPSPAVEPIAPAPATLEGAVVFVEEDELKRPDGKRKKKSKRRRADHTPEEEDWRAKYNV